MKLIPLKCPYCNSNLTLDASILTVEAPLRQAKCEYCGCLFLIDDEGHPHKTYMDEESARRAGYAYEQGRRDARKAFYTQELDTLQHLIDTLEKRRELKPAYSEAEKKYLRSSAAFERYTSAAGKIKSYTPSLASVLFGLFFLSYSIEFGLICLLASTMLVCCTHGRRGKKISSDRETLAGLTEKYHDLQSQLDENMQVDFTRIPKAYRTTEALQRLLYDLEDHQAADIQEAISLELHRDAADRCHQELLALQQELAAAKKSGAEAPPGAPQEA